MGDSMSTKLTPEIIDAAIAGFESQRQHIDSQIADLRAMLNGGRPDSVAPSHRSQRRRVSATARKRMADGQRRRWAAAKGLSKAATTTSPKRKRRLSPAGRAAIVAALKKRWALKRALPARLQSVGRRKAAPKKAAPKKAAVRKAA
jgi:hypothetical protein